MKGLRVMFTIKVYTAKMYSAHPTRRGAQETLADVCEALDSVAALGMAPKTTAIVEAIADQLGKEIMGDPCTPIPVVLTLDDDISPVGDNGSLRPEGWAGEAARRRIAPCLIHGRSVAL
jgi:hypothetical protein